MRNAYVFGPRSMRGQALPVAIAALALGALLVTPLLNGAGTSSRFTNVVGQRSIDRYSMDAGVEWSGWRLMADPRLTSDPSFTDVPLEPMPAAINGQPFPLTEIRYVAGAGGVEAVNIEMQDGGGTACYAVSASEAGTLSARIAVDAGAVRATLLAAAASCTLPPDAEPLAGASPYGIDLEVLAPGAYQLLVSADPGASGDIELTVPAATYEVRSAIDERNVVARMVAGYSGVKVVSWQLN